ncbi:hypothetical protein [Pandoraea sp. NPDC087047]|uniref:hypothetical protein n=1 Tax=Pandoraea sp. NPDC087047 TaxID=3364390 RepID=UPI003803C7A8
MTHLTNQSNRPALLFLFFFIESFEAQDNSDKSGEIPQHETSEIPTPHRRLKIALFFWNCNSVNSQYATPKPRETTSSTKVINAPKRFTVAGDAVLSVN